MIRVITSFCCLLLLDYFRHAKAKHLPMRLCSFFTLTFASLNSLFKSHLSYFDTGFAEVALLLFFLAGLSNLNSEATIGEWPRGLAFAIL
jgi:hypothetical protein